MLKTLIDHLAQELNMEELITSPEENHYILPFNNEVDVEAVQLDKSYLLKAIIGSPPEKNCDTFMMKVAEANLFGIGTRDSVIGLKQDEKLLTLSMELRYNDSYKNFMEKLEDFVTVIEFWRNEALNHH